LHRYLYAYANPLVWIDLTGYANILLPHDLQAMEEAKDDWIWRAASVSPEGAAFTEATGNTTFRGGGGAAVGRKSSRQVSSAVRAVVGDQKGATALVVEADDSPASIAEKMDEQLGTRWRRAGGRELLNHRLAEAEPGDIIDISIFYRVAVKDTLAANDSDLQEFARWNAEKVASTSSSEAPAEHIAALSARIAGSVDRTVRLAGDKDAPCFMRDQAIGDIAENAMLLATPFKAAGRGKALGEAARGVGRATSNTGRSTIARNAAFGRARQSYVQGKLEGKFGKGNVQSEQYLRNADGTIAKDPVTGTARRIDHVVVENGKVRFSVETTSRTADKSAQVTKEARIRAGGGTFVRDRTTGQLVDLSNVPTKVSRRK